MVESLPEVELRGDAEARALAPSLRAATEDDYHAAYLALILAVKIVDDRPSAVAHI